MESYKRDTLWTKNNDEIIVFDSVSFALEDYSTLRMFCELSKKKDIVTFIELVPQLSNPKDLFGLTKNGKGIIKLRGVS